MRVLVTGASGLIGRAVCDALLARGDEVIGLSRDPDRARETNARVGWHAWRPTEEQPPSAALDGVEGVINLVGETLNQRWTEAAKERIMASRETATRNLVAGLASGPAPPQVLVSQSAVGYYGEQGEAIVDESTPPGESFDARVCVAWEAAAREIEGAGVRLAITRTAPVLTPEGGLLKQLLLPFKLGLGGPIAGGRNHMAWITLDDEVGILLWALDTSSVEGAYNAAAPEPVTNRELTKALGRALGRPAVLPIPKLAVTARLGSEAAEIATASLRVVPRRAQDEGYTFRHPDIDTALAAALGD